MTYVDGFVLPVKKKNISIYKKMAQDGARMWKKAGALRYFECVGDDLHSKWVKLTFPKMAKIKPGETVFFSFITYKSRKHRDSVNARVMKGMEKNKDKYKDMQMPFDMKRMAYGGFRAIVEK